MSENLKKCAECGHKISINAVKCPKCGLKAQTQCKICHTNIAFDSKYCPECGDPSPIGKLPKTGVQKIGKQITSVATSNAAKNTIKIVLIITTLILGMVVNLIMRATIVSGALPTTIVFGLTFLIARFIWRFNKTPNKKISNLSDGNSTVIAKTAEQGQKAKGEKEMGKKC